MRIHRRPGRGIALDALALAALSAAVLAAAGCLSPGANSDRGAAGAGGVPAAGEVRRLQPADAHAAVSRGGAVIIDVREAWAFADGHIVGAESIPLDEIASRSGGLPRDRTILLYCSCPAEEASLDAARRLLSLGVRNTAVLAGGYPAWKKAGYAVSEPPN